MRRWIVIRLGCQTARRRQCSGMQAENRFDACDGIAIIISALTTDPAAAASGFVVGLLWLLTLRCCQLQSINPDQVKRQSEICRLVPSTMFISFHLMWIKRYTTNTSNNRKKLTKNKTQTHNTKYKRKSILTVTGTYNVNSIELYRAGITMTLAVKFNSSQRKPFCLWMFFYVTRF